MAGFNPLDKVNLGRSVGEAMLESKPHPLDGLPRFDGAGIYALYYRGGFPAYASIVERNRKESFEAPLYVGEAVSPGARKGNFGLDPGDGPYLHNRLMQHAKSIRLADNLDIADFYCRYLVVDDIWIPLGEALLIAKFSPVWNKLIDGFGNHDPGKGRYNGLRPRWDVLHPGRSWALKCQPRAETPEQIAQEIIAHMAALPDLESLFAEPQNGDNGSNSASQLQPTTTPS
jgi:hypothetical protein